MARSRSGRNHNPSQGHRISGLRSMFDQAPAPVLALYLLCITALVFLATQNREPSGDSPSIAYLPVSIIHWGSLRLDPIIDKDPLFRLAYHPHYVVAAGGHYYSKFSPVPSLLALPIYAPYIWLTGDVHSQSYLALSRVVAVLISSTITALLFLALRRIVSQHQAVLLALGYAFCAFTWNAATNTLASQSSGELFLTLAALAALQIASESQRDEHARTWRYAALGAALAVALAARTNLLLVVVVLGAGIGLQARRRWQALMALVIGALPAGLLLAAYNTYAFGSPFSTGYQDEAAGGWTTPIWVGLPGILFSPAHGLLMYSPFLLLAALGGWAVWRRASAIGEPHVVGLGRALAVACLAQLLLMSHWWAWHGGGAYQQRMLQEIHPLLVLLLAFGLRTYGANRAFLPTLLVAAVWSIGINAANLAFYDGTWEGAFRADIVWSLGDAEVLAFARRHGPGMVLAGTLWLIIRALLVALLPTLILARLVSIQQRMVERRPDSLSSEPGESGSGHSNTSGGQRAG